MSTTLRLTRTMHSSKQQLGSLLLCVGGSCVTFTAGIMAGVAIAQATYIALVSLVCSIWAAFELYSWPKNYLGTETQNVLKRLLRNFLNYFFQIIPFFSLYLFAAWILPVPVPGMTSASRLYSSLTDIWIFSLVGIFYVGIGHAWEAWRQRRPV